MYEPKQSKPPQILTLILLLQTNAKDEREIKRERREHIYRSQNGKQNGTKQKKEKFALRKRCDQELIHTMNRSRLNIFIVSSILNIAR